MQLHLISFIEKLNNSCLLSLKMLGRSIADTLEKELLHKYDKTKRHLDCTETSNHFQPSNAGCILNMQPTAWTCVLLVLSMRHREKEKDTHTENEGERKGWGGEREESQKTYIHLLPLQQKRVSYFTENWSSWKVILSTFCFQSYKPIHAATVASSPLVLRKGSFSLS